MDTKENMATPIPIISYARNAPELAARWDDAVWRDCAALEINHFHPQSSGHRPRTQVKLCYDQTNLYLIYKVEDQFVVVRNTASGSNVYEDSCVEAFLQPGVDTGYINFEANAGGAILASHITDPTRVPGGFKDFKLLTENQLAKIQISTTLPRQIIPERTEPMQWQLAMRIPFSIFTEFMGIQPPKTKTTWRGNFFKCADKCSHPHWAAWSPVGDELNFHQPKRFGELVFG